MKTFKYKNIEYYIGSNPINNLPMLKRVDDCPIENRKEICREFLRMHGYDEEYFKDRITNILEREVKKILESNNETISINESNHIKQPKKPIIRNRHLEKVQPLSEEDKVLIENIKNKTNKSFFTLDMVEQVLNNISKTHRFLVSEAHLQTQFIIEAFKLYPQYQYYPELVPSLIPNQYINQYGDKGIYFDLIIKDDNNKMILIEFKYLTKEYEEDINGFIYKVKHQSAQDIRRHDCWHDISRIEMFVNGDNNIIQGYFVLITNDSSYWKYNSNQTVDQMFRMHNGLHKKEIKTWNGTPSKGTLRGRDKPVLIQNNYHFEYKSFYKNESKNGEFKFLVVEINQQ